ncbi:MAG: acetyl-CoA carboxylase biotin carboxylase subunit [Proteobacteria bacterium]|nr:acetyl-CoA carboxylase biotin carboxylase subunit [Pseudomonadota bacterium]
MFEKILVANRGEIACRIMQACRELKIATVAVYSEADAGALHVEMADEAVCIGPPPNRDSYLNAANIISAAVITGAEAIHPGYGNLSEVPSFAEACEACKITFIGPPSSVIAKMGDKAEARKVMQAAGVPIIPGSEGAVSDAREARQLADKMGYPVRIKAVSGGGGRGIRVVQNPEQMAQALETARAEARAAFGNGDVYMEKDVEEPRHVEVQILADSHGNVIHLGERDCSIQYRNQKLLEESPCPAVSNTQRRRLGETAVKAAQAVGYVNAGTIEFLLDKRGKFYFMEMNTRIQVEHPVTEMLTGVDIVREQIRVAAGEKLSYEQGRIWFNGHAIECRILAADGDRDFMPSPGTLTEWRPSHGPGIRVDSGVAGGSTISSYYDPMVAKVICWDHSRAAAIAKMEGALRGMVVKGIRTTIPFHLRLLGNAHFRRGQVDTHFLERRMSGAEEERL